MLSYNESGNDQMKLTDLKYTKSQINQAGRTFRNGSLLEDEGALEILDNWRAVHSFPLQVFYMRLRRTSSAIDRNSLAARRLKRASSIIAKLQRSYHGRSPSMDLYQMQDIAGCRAILSNVDLAKKLTEQEYIKKKSDLKHILVGTKDYIANPKPDGYRSIHLIYSYRSSRKNSKYDGLLVEVQIRSKLQHIWATAVETVGLFTRQAIKSSEGSPEWNEFFRLLSSAFANMEKCPAVPNTPDNEAELYSQIIQKEKELQVINKVRGWANAMQIFDQRLKKRKAKFFLLELNTNEQSLQIYPFTKREEKMALSAYAALEKQHAGNKDYDVVLAGVDAAFDLKKAYPNYYVDMGEFLKHLENIVKKVEK